MTAAPARAGGFPAHRSTEADPAARGRAFGAAMAASVERTLRCYRRLFEVWSGLGLAAVRDRGTQVAAALAPWPELVEEIRGIAAGAGQDVRELLAVNARTELLGGGGPAECSVVGLLPRASGDGGTVLAQNWDWHPDSAPVLWSIATPDGHVLTTLTEAGIVAKIGCNDRGLGCCLNMLGADSDAGDAGGVPIHVLLRLVLERCGSVAEAVALLLDARVGASSAITVASDGGREEEPALATVELSPAGSRTLAPDAHGVLVHANHFLHADLRPHDANVRSWPETLERQRIACARLDARHGPVGGAALEALLRSHANAPDAICRHEVADVPYEDRDATLASVVMHLAEGRMLVAAGTPCTAPFRDVAAARLSGA
jgi:isopenicillin-N N-acyltransferase-like protein